MKLCIVVAVVLTLGVGALGEKPAATKEPKSSAVKRAVAKRDRAVEVAAAAYRRAVEEANKALLVELKKAKDAAMQAKDLDEANAVQALADRTNAEAGVPGEPSSPIPGTWRVRYTNGVTRDITIDGDDSVSYVEQGARHDGKPLRREGGDLWLRNLNGELERVSLCGDRMFSEYWWWSEGEKMPSEPPRMMGVGHRVSR